MIHILKRLGERGVTHHILVVFIVVIGIASIGAYRVYFSKAAIARVCYQVTPVSVTGRQIEGTKRFHAPTEGKSYPLGNSPQGLKYARDRGFTSADLDIQVTKDNVLVATHYPDPLKHGFYDPKGTLIKEAQIKYMTIDQAIRLRHTDGQSRIYRLTYLIGIADTYNMNLALDLKDPVRIKPKLTQIADTLNRATVRTYIKGDATTTGMNLTFAEARSLKFWTRGTLGTQDWKKPEPRNCEQIYYTKSSTHLGFQSSAVYPDIELVKKT